MYLLVLHTIYYCNTGTPYKQHESTKHQITLSHNLHLKYPKIERRSRNASSMILISLTHLP